MDWVGAVFVLFGFYFFGSHPWGYGLYILGELVYILWAWKMAPRGWGLIFVCAAFIVLAMRDYRKRMATCELTPGDSGSG